MNQSAELLERNRGLIEAELLSCATPITWAQLLAMETTVYERKSSCLVARDSLIGGEACRTVIVAAGKLSEVHDMVNQSTQDARLIGIKKIWFVGRRGWLKEFPKYKEIAVIAAREI